MLAELPSVTSVPGDYYSALPAVSRAGDLAAIARGTLVEVFALPSGSHVRTIVHSAAVNAVAFAPNGHDLVSGSIDGALLLTGDGNEAIALPTSSSGIDAVAILPNGRVVAADASRRLRVFDICRRTQLADLATTTRIRSLRPSSDGSRLITIPTRAKPAAPMLWDLAGYRLVAQLDGHLGRVFSARFAGDTQDTIVTAGNDGSARLWDSRTGQLKRIFSSATGYLSDAALSPDGSLLVTGGGDGQLRFWDVTTERQLWALQAHRSYIIGIRFDGSGIVTRDFTGDVSRWDIQRCISEQLIERCLSSDQLCEPTRPRVAGTATMPP